MCALQVSSCAFRKNFQRPCQEVGHIFDGASGFIIINVQSVHPIDAEEHDFLEIQPDRSLPDSIFRSHQQQIDVGEQENNVHQVDEDIQDENQDYKDNMEDMLNVFHENNQDEENHEVMDGPRYFQEKIKSYTSLHNCHFFLQLECPFCIHVLAY